MKRISIINGDHELLIAGVIDIKRTSPAARLEHLKSDLGELTEYPLNELAEILRDVGFECDLCGKCCTRQFNGHVFLLDSDTTRVKELEPAALVPAPDFEFCDQAGRFYVSGYALRFQPDGSCHFLEAGRCRIYDQRMSICRIYPYMLHKEADEDGRVDWRQISGLNEHGFYNTELQPEACSRMAEATKAYEADFIRQEMAFLQAVEAHFEKNGLKHVPAVYDRRLRQMAAGQPVEVLVYFNGDLELNTVNENDYR